MQQRAAVLKAVPLRPIIDFLYRLAYRVGFALALQVWRLRRPSHHGALVAILVDRRILLVRQSYRAEYSLPGGGVARGETALEAARRELVEELLVDVGPGDLVHVRTDTSFWDYRDDTVDFFELSLPTPPTLRIDNREIIEARLVRFDELASLPLTGPVEAYLRARPGFGLSDA